MREFEQQCSCGSRLRQVGEFFTDEEKAERAAWRKRHDLCLPDVTNTWRVERFGEDGECYIAEFFGPLAEERAREYAAMTSGEAVPLVAQ